MVTAADLAGTLTLSTDQFMAGIAAAEARVEQFAARMAQVTAATTLGALSLDTAAAQASLDAVAAAQRRVIDNNTLLAAGASSGAAALGGLATGAQAAGTGVEGLGAAQQQAASSGQILASALLQVNAGQSQTASSTAQASSQFADFVPKLAASAQQGQQAGAGLSAAGSGAQAGGQGAQVAANSFSSLNSIIGTLNQSITQITGVGLPGLGAALSGTNSAIDAAQNSSGGLSTKLALLGAGLGAAGVAAGVGFTLGFVNAETSLRNMSLITGLSISQVAGLTTAMQAQGLTGEMATRPLIQFSRQLEIMQQQLVAGKAPSDNFTRGLADLGVTATDAAGHVRPMGELLPEVADRFHALAGAAAATGQPFNAAGLASELFGARVGPMLLPLLEQGRSGMEAYTKQAEALGIGSEQQLAHLDALRQSAAQTGLALKADVLDVGSAVAPVMTDLSRGVGLAASAFASLPPPLQTLVVVAPLAAGGIALIGAALSATTGPIGLLALGIGGVVAVAELLTGGLHTASAAEDAYRQAVDQTTQSVQQETQALLAQGESQADVLAHARSAYAQVTAQRSADQAALEAYLQKLTQENGGHEVNTASLYKHDAAFRELSDAVTTDTARETGWLTVIHGLTPVVENATRAVATYGAQWGPAYGLFNVFVGATQRGLGVVGELGTQLGSSAAQMERTAGATKTLSDAMSHSSGSVQARAAFEAELADAVAHSSDTQDQAKVRYQALKDLADSGSPSVKAYAQSQLAVDSAVQILGPDAARAAVDLQGLTAAAGVQSGALAENAGHMRDLEAAVSSEKQSSQQAAVVQQQLAQAHTFASQGQDQQRTSLAALQLLIDGTSGSTRSYYEEQLKLDQAYAALKPDAADTAVEHQHLADTFGFAKDNAHDLNAELPGLIQGYHDGAISVHEFGQALLDLTSKPTQAELDLTVQLDAVKGKIADLNKELANGSYAEKHIADLEKVVLQDEATGASTDKLQKDQAALAFAMDNVKDPANRQGKSLEDLLFNLENQQKGIEGNLNSERAHRQSLEDTTKATVAHKDGSALSLDQIQKAYDAYATGAVGALQGVANKAGPAGKQVGEDNTRELATSMGAGLATLNDTLATLPAKLAQALTDPAHFKQAGTQNAASHGRGLLDGLDATKTDATNAAALLAGALTLPDAYASAGRANAQAFGQALLGGIRGAMAQVAGIVNEAGKHQASYGPVGPYGTGPGGFEYPTQGPITQRFGENGEKGLDIGVPVGTALLAGGTGRVTQVANPAPGVEGAGLWVHIDLGGGIEEVIGHLSEAWVKAGDEVMRNQVVGLSGGAVPSGPNAWSLGPHTEVQVLINGQNVDPASVLGKLLGGSPQEVATAAAAAGDAATASLGGHLLPPAWYAAIQANESTLPLPSAGSPQPMFGFVPGAPGSVGTGFYTSGGSAAASASLGVAAGQTAQSLFPSIEAGIAAFDDLVRRIPGAVAAVQAGDFGAFLRTIAPTYAGPGEAAGWPGQVLGHFQPGASLAGAGMATGTTLPGELPVAAAPDAATGIKAENTALSDLDQAIGAHNTILQQQRDLQGQVHDGYVQTTIDQLTQAHTTTESARSTASGLLAITDAAQQEWQASIAGFDPATKASRTYTQAEIENARLRYVEAKRNSDAALAVFKDDLSAEQQASRATEAERAAMSAAVRQLAAERRGDLKTEADLVSGLATTYRKFVTDVTEISATAGPHAGGIFGNSEAIVQLASNAAGGAAQAYHDAEARVLADEQALTGAMGSEDRKRLQDQLDVDKASAGDVLQTAKDEAASFGLIEDAFHQMVTNMQAASRARMNLDAFGFSDFTDAVLKSVNLPVDAQTTADEARLREARMTWEMMVADSQAASQQLIRDLAALNAATDPMERARAQAAVNADQARISSDQAAASAIVQQYGTIQTAVQDDMHREIDAAKTAAQAKITNYETARDALIKANDDAKTSADNLLRSEEQDLDASLQKRLDTIAAADTAEKASIDTSAQQRIDAIQGQLDAEQRLKEQQQLTTYQGAVRTATSPEQRRAAEAQLADFQMQLHDRMLQDQIKAIQHAAEEQKKAADLAAKTQTDTAKDAAAAQKLTWENQTRTHKQELDKQTAAVKDFYNGPDGLITQQQRAVKALEATSQQHYRAQESDAVTDAKHLLSITSGNQQDQVNAITAAGPLYTQAGQAAGTDLGKGMTMGAGVALTAAGGALLGASTSLFTGALSTGAAHAAGGGTLAVDSPWLAHIGTVLTDMAGWMSGPGIKVQPVAPAAGGTTSGGTWNITIPVYQQPGQDARALAMAIRQEFEALMRDQLGRGSFLGSVRRGS